MTKRSTIIKNFLASPRHYEGFNSDMAENLLGGRTEYSLWCASSLETPFRQERFFEDVRVYVTAYTRDKDRAIELYKLLHKYIEKKLAIVIEMEWPPIRISSELDRLMYITKRIQTDDCTIQQLSDELWVGEKTIRNDLDRIAGKRNAIEVCGNKLVVEPGSNGVRSKNTVHPLFLACNIQDIISLLYGLYLQSEFIYITMTLAMQKRLT